MSHWQADCLPVCFQTSTNRPTVNVLDPLPAPAFSKTPTGRAGLLDSIDITSVFEKDDGWRPSSGSSSPKKRPRKSGASYSPRLGDDQSPRPGPSWLRKCCCVLIFLVLLVHIPMHAFRMARLGQRCSEARRGARREAGRRNCAAYRR